ncbi:glycoside hydrolase family 71/99-like protein [Polaribacter gangjinensis]|uniref:Xylosidase n=1 Tax=Polaribacter gangjinensis TaxID=574710 RepID=A0A2S7WF98_9FLAO|nr:glycoside hydrolase family 71/99-like protein [Polaribacter gangjinensis]PQJ75922.1 xylosidase [Polaribacter gangjinensis]
MRKQFYLLILVFCTHINLQAQSKHGKSSNFSSYKGLVMAGYQGWFRTPDDGAKKGWGHYGVGQKFDYENNTIDFWPDVTEYKKTYKTSFKYPNGEYAAVFSSLDKSTTELHFSWMKQYGVDGVFMQRFFGVARNHIETNKPQDIILKNALQAAKENNRAIAVMYDLSGLKATDEDCSAIIEDWKMLVNQLKITNQGENQPYLYHNNKPLIAIWGVGFPDRPYDTRKIGINRLIDFLKNDPEYGGCSIMLGVPTYFRELDKDCLPDPYLHEIIKSVDILMPWMVQRFTPLVHNIGSHLRDHIIADIAWTKTNNLDYVPVVTPGFSWRNLSMSTKKTDRYTAYGAIPRLGGKFYWEQMSNAILAGSEMIYVAMFDEIDEGTAIMKVSDNPPNSDKAFFVNNDGVPSDHYLWLTGLGAKMLRKEIPLQILMPQKVNGN